MERKGTSAGQTVVWYAARLRNVRQAFAQRPAFSQHHLHAVLASLPDLRATLREAGLPARTHEAAIHAIGDSAEYASAALDASAWDAAAVELERMVEALAEIEGDLVMAARRPGAPKVRRLGATAFGFGRRPPALFAWRRIDVALAGLERARRAKEPGDAIASIQRDASLDRLRPYVLRAVAAAHRDVRVEVRRLLDEGQEAADYALAALGQHARSAARVDMDRLDASLRAIRHIVQRESTVYLPEPWPFRLPVRWSTGHAVRREAAAASRRRAEETIAHVERRMSERAQKDVEVGAP